MDQNDPKWTAVVVTKGNGSSYLVLAAGIIIGINGEKITGISDGRYYWY